MPTDPRYIPPKIPGMVFFSNSPKVDYETKKENTEESLKKYFNIKYNIPEDEIQVLQMLSHDFVKFSVYLDEKYKPLVIGLSKYLDLIIETFKDNPFTDFS